jgi:hypothetical protein
MRGEFMDDNKYIIRVKFRVLKDGGVQEHWLREPLDLGKALQLAADGKHLRGNLLLGDVVELVSADVCEVVQVTTFNHRREAAMVVQSSNHPPTYPGVDELGNEVAE